MIINGLYVWWFIELANVWLLLLLGVIVISTLGYAAEQ